MIVGLLGAGGMGEVHRARDRQLGREVALKVLPRRLAGSPEFRQRFEREGRLLAAFNHPHVAAIYGLENRGEDSALVRLSGDGQVKVLEFGIAHSVPGR